VRGLGIGADRDLHADGDRLSIPSASGCAGRSPIDTERQVQARRARLVPVGGRAGEGEPDCLAVARVIAEPAQGGGARHERCGGAPASQCGRIVDSRSRGAEALDD